MPGFADTPALAGSVTYEADGAHASAAMLQAYVAGAGDAWAAMLVGAGLGSATRRRDGRADRRPDGAAPSRPRLAAGRRRRFPARPATVAETAAWRASAERQLTLAVDSVRGAEHERLVALAPAVRARFADALRIGDR